MAFAPGHGLIFEEELTVGKKRTRQVLTEMPLPLVSVLIFVSSPSILPVTHA